MRTLLPALTRYWFLIGIALAALAAYAAPQFILDTPIASTGAVRIAVAAIFFLQGLLIDSAQLRAGLAAWRLHTLVQATIFLVAPVVFLALLWLCKGALHPTLVDGFIYLAILPTTLSNCVVYTSLARGNVAASALNSSIANILGVVLVPIISHIFITAKSSDVPILESMLSVGLISALPFFAGTLLRRWIRLSRSIAQNATSAAIVAIIYVSFCKAFAAQNASNPSAIEFVLVFAITIAAFTLLNSFLLFVARLLKLSAPDTATAVFCGSQKTLAAGAPLAHVLFPNHPSLALLLLPILLYHPIQLLVGAWIVHRLAPKE